MQHISQNFSIKDLEHLSGIKAHTIRIWEKRYNILKPDRTDTNIRTYDIGNLQKILNVTFLNAHGYKISRIAKLNDEEICTMVKEVAATASEESRAINSFKIAMINFDEALFNSTYSILTKKKTFRNIFHEVFMPLLTEIGLLWQTDTINPVHEHFITGLIKQKLYCNIAQLEVENEPTSQDLYVLFLPENEIHDLGILFLNYELNFHGRKTIFLGPSMPISDMKYLLEIHSNPKFVSYLTVLPTNIFKFIEEFELEICKDSSKKELHLMGVRVQKMEPTNLPENIKTYQSILEFVNLLEK